MANMSGQQIITQLQASQTLAQFQKRNTIIYKQQCYMTQRRLSPWLGKRRASKTFKSQKKASDTQKQFKSEKTQLFLRKIFPQRKSRQRQQTINISGSSIYLDQMHKKSMSERKQITQQQPIIYIPIKPINFQKFYQPKQKKEKQIKQDKQIQLTKRTLHKIEPSINIKQRINDSYDGLKVSPISLTFRKSWRKKQKCITQPKQSIDLTKISIKQVYRLIGQNQKNNHQIFNSQFEYQQQNIHGEKKVVQKSNWLVSRNLKNKNKFKTKIPLFCKTQNI